MMDENTIPWRDHEYAHRFDAGDPRVMPPTRKRSVLHRPLGAITFVVIYPFAFVAMKVEEALCRMIRW